MKTRKVQQDFFSKQSEFRPHRISHGGDIAKGKRKLERPLDRRKSLHVTMKASVAKESLSMLGPSNRLEIDRIIRTVAKRNAVTVIDFENMGNHLHFHLRFATRKGIQNFLRTVAALIARFVTKARKGRPFGRRFWDALAFTRVVTGRRDWLSLKNYFFKNSVERDVSSFGREAIELHEKAERTAKRRGCEVWEVLNEWNRSAGSSCQSEMSV